MSRGAFISAGSPSRAMRCPAFALPDKSPRKTASVVAMVLIRPPPRLLHVAHGIVRVPREESPDLGEHRRQDLVVMPTTLPSGQSRDRCQGAAPAYPARMSAARP